MPLFARRPTATVPDLLPPPGLHLLAMEFRAPWEFGAVLPAWPLLQNAPLGDGHSIIVFPGLTAGDPTTLPLRHYLESRNYQTFGWGQGLNLGPRPGVLETARRMLEETCQRSGARVSLVGWSLGGVYARELAKEMPDRVRCVITLGTPFAGPHTSTNAWRIYQFASGRDPGREHEQHDLPVAPPVPTTSIYSRSDGVVAWRGSIQAPAPHNPHTENIEVVASHFGLGLNPSAWWVVADRLSQPAGMGGTWKPFQRPRIPGGRLLFPDPQRG
ncbi:MAG: alpha/beta hydrolase [Burkholderiales bacterium]|nr:alpha/beta hydrolase [Burkholderiales bacterium]